MGFSECDIADVFVRIGLLEHTKETHTVSSTLSPCWDETLMIKDIKIYGHPNLHMVKEPVQVLVQLFDRDGEVRFSV